MKTFQFSPIDSLQVIVVPALLNNRIELNLAIDTAATHTTIDSSILKLSGYKPSANVSHVQVETSNGRIFTELHLLQSFTAFEVAQRNFEVQVYDFNRHGIISGYDGVIGLDFLRHIRFCLDISKGIITVDD